MQIEFDKIQADGQGSFFVHDKITGNNIFHFVLNIDDKIKLKKKLQDHLNEQKQQKKDKDDIRAKIELIVSGLI